MEKTIHRKGITQIHLAVFLFGFAGLFGKFLSCDPFYIVFGRTGFAAIALFVYSKVAAKHPLPSFRRGQRSYLILQGILLALHWWTFFVAIRISSVAVGLVTFSTFPLFVTFLEPVFFRERLKLRDVMTAFAVFIGIVLVIPELDMDNNITKGSFFGITSGLTFALLALVNRKNARTSDAVGVAFYQNLFATLFLILPLTLFKVPLPTGNEIAGLLFLGVVCTALSHTLFIGALKSIRAQTAAVIAGLEPVYGIILAFFMLNETPGIRVVFGGVIIIGSTVAAGIFSGSKTCGES